MNAEQLLFLLTFTAAATVAQVAATFICDRIKGVSHAALSYRITRARELAEQADMKADGAHARVSMIEDGNPPTVPAKRGRKPRILAATVAAVAPAKASEAEIPFDRDAGDEHAARPMLDMGRIESGLEASGRG